MGSKKLLGKRQLVCMESKQVCAYGNQSSVKVLMSGSRLAIKVATSGTIKKQLVQVRTSTNSSPVTEAW